MPKTITLHFDAHMALRDGVDRLAEAVRVTYGPRGRTAIVERDGRPVVTQDGATVARAVELTDAVENAGARLLRDVALRTDEAAGDGTTTAVVLAQALLHGVFKRVTAGHSPVVVKQGVEHGAEVALEALRGLAEPVRSREEVERVAALAAGDDELGRLVADAYERAGADGLVTAEAASGTETTLVVTEGVRLGAGFLSPRFADAERGEVVLEDAHVLLTDEVVTDAHELVPILEEVAREGRRLLLVAGGVEGEARTLLLRNVEQALLVAVAVQVPGLKAEREALLGDLALMTGTTVASASRGRRLAAVRLADLGGVCRAVVTADETILTGGDGERAATNRERVRQRLARLKQTRAVLRIGGATEVEATERLRRAEDAVNAARAALEEGVVPGGGVAFVRAQRAVAAQVYRDDDAASGAAALREALQAPLFQLAENSGFQGRVVVEYVREGTGDYGFNVRTGRYEPLREAGVLDPLKVVRLALEHAVSVVGLLATTEAVVTDAGDAVDADPSAASS